jgi:hypothetical protein
MTYALFAGDNYYPCGGWEDFQGFFDSLEEAQSVISFEKPVGDKCCVYDWAHIVDLEQGKVVWHPTFPYKDIHQLYTIKPDEKVVSTSAWVRRQLGGEWHHLATPDAEKTSCKLQAKLKRYDQEFFDGIPPTEGQCYTCVMQVTRPW